MLPRRGSARRPGVGSGSATSGAGTSLATSIYETRLSLAALSWSHAALGLSLRVVLHVSAGASPSSSGYGCDGGDGVEYGDGDEDGEKEAIVAVRVRPWLVSMPALTLIARRRHRAELGGAWGSRSSSAGRSRARPEAGCCAQTFLRPRHG